MKPKPFSGNTFLILPFGISQHSAIDWALLERQRRIGKTIRRLIGPASFRTSLLITIHRDEQNIRHHQEQDNYYPRVTLGLANPCAVAKLPVATNKMVGNAWYCRIGL